MARGAGNLHRFRRAAYLKGAADRKDAGDPSSSTRSIRVKKEDILKTIETYKDAYHFKEVIPVSAMKKTNTDNLIHTIFQYLPEGPQYYDEDTVTDQPMRQIAAELIREKAPA